MSIEQLYCRYYASPLGKMLLIARSNSLCGIYFNQRALPLALNRGIFTTNAVLDATEKWLNDYFYAGKEGLRPPYHLNGTAFQQEVWQGLCFIRWGHTLSYRDLAVRLGYSPKAARAVGSACGKNPLSILLPCHRVIGSTGKLGGYAGGQSAKLKLLAHEGVDTAGLKLT